jgi:hypothetical protein
LKPIAASANTLSIQLDTENELLVMTSHRRLQKFKVGMLRIFQLMIVLGISFYIPTTVQKRAALFEAKASTPAQNIFLSHSTKDNAHVDRVVLFFADFDAEVSSDNGDQELPAKPDPETASLLKQRIRQLCAIRRACFTKQPSVSLDSMGASRRRRFEGCSTHRDPADYSSGR